ncbi:VPLPA-CTERM sorting domain-containing protein [Methylobacter sp. Wu1]|uniref:VPLPA-CTERM sorting domain-containing protein n=1 Tax=Methylobacter sp. Wu1 TaxID=3119359 RepID=UPI002F91D773
MKKISLAGLLFLFSISNANAALLNIGFETGDFSDWTLIGTGSVKNDSDHPEGQYYGSITGNSSLIQSTDFFGGETIEFMWKFVANDYLPYNDFAFFVGDQYFKLSDVATVGDYGNSGWNKFSYTVAETYFGPIMFGIANVGDSGLSSELKLDSVSAVPVPAAIWLFGSAIMGLVGFSRRKS